MAVTLGIALKMINWNVEFEHVQEYERKLGKIKLLLCEVYFHALNKHKIKSFISKECKIHIIYHFEHN